MSNSVFFFRCFRLKKNMNLNEINRVGVAAEKPLIKVQHLTLETPYPILRAKIVNGKFGESVWVELKEVSCFLPKRATNAFRNQIDEFATGKYGLVFRGLKPSKNSRYSDSILFEIVEI